MPAAESNVYDPSARHRVARLRKAAKRLLRAVRSGDAAAIEIVRQFHPALADAGADDAHVPAGFTLADAQLVVARSAGFASWPRLREHLDVVGRYARSTGQPRDGGTADEFLRSACPTSTPGDGVEDARQIARARWLVGGASGPGLGRSVDQRRSAGNLIAARSMLAADPSLADRDGGAVRLATVAVPDLFPDRRRRPGPLTARRGQAAARPRRRPERGVPARRPTAADDGAGRRAGGYWPSGRPVQLLNRRSTLTAWRWRGCCSRQAQTPTTPPQRNADVATPVCRASTPIPRSSPGARPWASRTHP